MSAPWTRKVQGQTWLWRHWTICYFQRRSWNLIDLHLLELFSCSSTLLPSGIFSKSWKNGQQPFHVSVLLAKASMTVSYGTEAHHLPSVPKSIFTATDRRLGLSVFLTNKRVQERICDVLRRLGCGPGQISAPWEPMREQRWLRPFSKTQPMVHRPKSSSSDTRC